MSIDINSRTRRRQSEHAPQEQQQTLAEGAKHWVGGGGGVS
jgi:hypothetical protein